MLKLTKKTIRLIIEKLGFQLQVKKINRGNPKPYSLNVGKFNIECLTDNGLIYCYENCKEYGLVIKRLVRDYVRNFNNLEVIDIGANIGDTICLIKSGEDVPVLAIEGDISIIPSLQKNTAQFRDITILPLFLGEKQENITVSFEKANHNMTLTPVENGKVINLTTLDKLFDDGTINSSHKILKVDTEGFDLKILNGGIKYLQQIKPVLYYEYNLHCLLNIENNPEDFIFKLKDIGYYLFLLYDNDGNFLIKLDVKNLELFKVLDNYTRLKESKIYYFDIVAIHSSDLEFGSAFYENEEINRKNSSQIKISK